MWPRVVELMLGVWLTIAGLVFRGTPAIENYAWVDATAGSLVILLSLVSFWRPLRRAHLGTLGVAVVLACYGYFSAPRPGPPAAQNEIATGLLLLLFAIIPSEASRPPDAWRSPKRA